MNRELYSDFTFFLLLESSKRAIYKVLRSRDSQKSAFKATLIHEDPTFSPSMVLLSSRGSHVEEGCYS
jgi:hypothetical protein